MTRSHHYAPLQIALEALAETERQAEALRRLVVALEAVAPVEEPAETDGDLLDTWTASQRFSLPPDTVRWIAREKRLGVKIGHRWMISARELGKYLDRTRE